MVVDRVETSIGLQPVTQVVDPHPGGLLSVLRLSFSPARIPNDHHKLTDNWVSKTQQLKKEK
jgi:hypothetical protein